jgi:hypothetical protein
MGVCIKLIDYEEDSDLTKNYSYNKIQNILSKKTINKNVINKNITRIPTQSKQHKQRKQQDKFDYEIVINN